MTDDSETVECGEHGESSVTYVCEHLIEQPSQRWYCDVPSIDNRWPDAWCKDCEAEFVKEGEWNDKNSENVPIKLLCSGCYESLIGQSVGRLKGKAAEKWASFLASAHDELHEKQAQLDRGFDIGKHKRWDWDQVTAELIFSNDGVAAVKCKIAFIGSVSAKSNTWLWSWANFSLLEQVRAPILTVRQYGEERDLPKLTVPKWIADEVDGWEMAGVAAKILNAKGVYRTPGDHSFAFLAILDVQWVQ
jgi:hypothetical protein